MKNLNTEKSILLLSCRPWNQELDVRLKKRLNMQVLIINEPKSLSGEKISKISPDWIFVTHWNEILPAEIWSKWPTVIFHMTDLPYGRGGSPLQNLIKQGKKDTKLTALRCCKAVDAGDIYMKRELSLYGSAEEIFLRTDLIIEDMIVDIVKGEISPTQQIGKATIFKRRTPAESNLGSCKEQDLDSWYDQIRMLDAEGYPHAYIEVQGMRLEFRRVSRRADGLHADVKITSLKNQQSTTEGIF